MTKIKNTKKGMAKKTLSISLVAAMLATSNVPVWATEFGDGSNDTFVEFSSDAEDVAPAAAVEEVVTDAPVVEEEAVPAAKDAVTVGDITVDLKATDTNNNEIKSAVWNAGTTADVKISGIITKNGANLTKWYYRWVDEDGISFTEKNTEATTIDGMSLVTTSAMAGKTLTLWVYDNTTTPTFDINTGVTISVEKREIKDFTVTATQLVYNGFNQTLSPDTVSGVEDEKQADVVNTPASTTTSAVTNYKVTTTSAKNAGDEYFVTVSAEENSPYTGSVTKKVSTIAKKTYAAGDLIASTKTGQTYQYTGKAITVPVSQVTVKESLSANNGADGKLSGQDLSSAIKTATIKPATGDIPRPGDLEVSVVINKDKLANINSNDDITLTTEETVKVTKRDLSTNGTKITVKNGAVKTGTTASDLYQSLIFTGIDGTALSLTNNVDYKVSVKKGNDVIADTATLQTGSYTVTVEAVDNGYCTGSQTFTVSTTDNVLENCTVDKLSENTYHYTGAAIEPSKSDLGNLTVNGSATTANGELQAESWEIVGYKNNIDATTYNSDGTVKKTAYVTVKITKGSYIGQTFDLPFTINPLEVTADYVSVPSTITYNEQYKDAKEYNVPVTVVAKNSGAKKTIVKTLAPSDYTVKYDYIKLGGADNKTIVAGSNKKHDFIRTTVTVTNPNYIYLEDDTKTTIENKKTQSNVIVTPAKVETVGAASSIKGATELVAKALTGDMIKVAPESYTYTGGKIVPSYVVMDGVLVLYKQGTVAPGKEEYKEVSITDAVNVGTGTITVEGMNDFYSGTAKATFQITPANTSDVKVEIEDEKYTGSQVRPRAFKATLNGNDVTSQFEIVSYGTNTEAGKGSIVLRPVASTKNFTGSDITAEFNIVKETISAKLSVYDEKGFDITSDWEYTLDDNGTATKTPAAGNRFAFDGAEKAFAKAVLSELKSVSNPTVPTKATVDDLEIKYVDNISGKKVGTGTSSPNIAYVYAVAKEGTGFSGNDTIVTADGTVIKGVVAKVGFAIDSVKFVAKNVSVKNGTYAAGLPVRPEVLVQIGGNTLVEGKDYIVKTVELTDLGWVEFTTTEVTNGKIHNLVIEGINGYQGSIVWPGELKWGVDKKNLKDCNITVKDGVVTVLNGYLPVAATEYTSVNNGDGTYTVSAAEGSKNYTGSVTVDATGKAEDEKPDAPMIKEVKVVGNNATVILSGESEGAAGYDYVISTDRNCITTKDYDKVNKNVLNTDTNFTYAQQGVYYAYCHAWKRGEDGKKVFSDWSNAYPFVVSAVTPDQPGITSVKVSGSTVTVTYTKAANADGYDVVLGTAVKKVAGESRPVEYGKLVKKNIKGNVVTATFKNVKKGTYYAGLHAYNRTSEDGKKVFSPWSNTKKVTVK